MCSTARKVVALTWHRDSVWEVHWKVACKLCSLQQVEDDGVLLANKGVSDIVQRQRGGHILGHAHGNCVTRCSRGSYCLMNTEPVRC
jgi:hypothetical protein